MTEPIIEIVPLEAFEQDPHNANKGTARGLGMTETSIRERGAARSIVAVRGRRINSGNHTWEAALNAGITEAIVVHSDGNRLVVVQRDDVDPDSPQARKLALEDNRSSQVGLDWDVPVLLSEPDLLAGMFRDDEIANLLASLDEPKLAGAGGDEFDTTPADGPTRTQLGDLWQLGKHRLLCGDSTDPAAVARLMGGERADMVFTDPPYGVDYIGGLNDKERERLAGDNSADLYGACMAVTPAYCKPSAPWYIWFAASVGKPVYEAVESAGYKVRALIVWNKLDAHYGNFMAQYMQKHEPCLYCVRSAPPWFGPSNEVTVWDVKQPTRNDDHPTQKPIELATRAIGNSSAAGAIVADWFLGSGTTLIAAERTGRKCYGLEIEPRYCDVILRRFEAESGLAAERIG